MVTGICRARLPERTEGPVNAGGDRHLPIGATGATGRCRATCGTGGGCGRGTAAAGETAAAEPAQAAEGPVNVGDAGGTGGDTAAPAVDGGERGLSGHVTAYYYCRVT